MKCCKECAWWDRKQAEDKAGRVRKDRVATCRWVFNGPLPSSLSIWSIPSTRYTTATEGVNCPCFTTSEEECEWAAMHLSYEVFMNGKPLGIVVSNLGYELPYWSQRSAANPDNTYRLESRLSNGRLPDNMVTYHLRAGRITISYDKRGEGHNEQ